MDENGGVRLKAPPFVAHCVPKAAIVAGASEIDGIEVSGAMRSSIGPMALLHLRRSRTILTLNRHEVAAGEIEYHPFD